MVVSGGIYLIGMQGKVSARTPEMMAPAAPMAG